MKYLRAFLGLLLASAITACSLLPGIRPVSPTSTAIPSLTFTPLITPTFTATATPQPVVRIEVGDHAFFNGDYPTALIHYQTAYKDSPDPALRSAAKWGEARVLYEQGRALEALIALETLIAANPETTRLAQAYFLQGQVNYGLKRYAEAAKSWQNYLELRPNVLPAYVQELRGDAFFLAENYADALSAYTASIQAPRLDDGIRVDMKIADTHAKLGENDVALVFYDDIMSRAPNDYLRAEIAYQSGLLLIALGRPDEAHKKYQLAVENYPLSGYSYLCLVELVNAGVGVDDLARGLVDYYAGQYDVAIAAFDRYIAANPNNDGSAHYFRALSLRELGNYGAAVDAFTTFTNNYSSNPRWEEAWGDKAYTQWFYLGKYPEAAQTLLDFVKAVPTSPSAVDYLMSAARIYERDDRFDEAIQIWTRVANEYPGDSQAATAIFIAGITDYRRSDYYGALASFNQSLTLAQTSPDKARAYLWIGKTQLKLGDSGLAIGSWQKGQSLDPDGYYSGRSRDLLTDRDPFAPPRKSNLTIDLKEERKNADAWMRLTFQLPANADLNGLASLAEDPRMIRGTEYWELGLYDEARLEFESVRESVSDNAVASYRLGNYLLDLGLYRSAIFASRQTLTLAGLDDHAEAMMAPPYFSHLRYGLYYSDIVVEDAQAEGFDPLFLFSVIRQESLFEGFIHSTAGARGLMQIIPSTGANVAGQLGWPLNYSDNDLYRPDVSVRLGAHYLATNRDILDKDLYAALAAYNGGPGNAALWKQLSGDDPDLFLEVVRFEETRNYIRNIYEIYLIYIRLYGSSPLQ